MRKGDSMRLFISALIFVLAVLSFAAMKSPVSKAGSAGSDPRMVDAASLRDNEKTTIVGRLRLVGNEPFTSYVITPLSNFDVFIDEKSVGGRENIAKLQYKVVEASGTIRVFPLRRDEEGNVLVKRFVLIVNDIREYKGEYKE